jgi:glycosyltransferase involved in cell wall biosynthesis
MLETDGPGGAELLLHELCLELRNRGHRVVPVGPLHGPGWLSARLKASGFERRTFSLRRPLDPGALRAMVKMLRDEGVEAIHSHEFTMAVYGCAAARWLDLPHVITMHGDQGVTSAWRRRAALRWAFRHSSTVAVSDHTRCAMEARLGLADRTVGCIHNGIPEPRGEREHVRRELGIDNDETLVLAVGSLRPNKGHRVLLEALAGEGAPSLEWKLAIAGRGEEDDALRRQAQALGIQERVHLLGQRDDIDDVQAAADVFVMPSFAEGMPLALLEAMFAGSAIVASDVGGIPEAVRHEREALLTRPGCAGSVRDEVVRFLQDPALRRQFGDAARRRALANFGIGEMTDRYESLYRGEEGGLSG